MSAETIDKITGEISPTPYQLLPRLTDEEYAALKADIAENGIRVPIDVDENGTVIDGHHRSWIAADLHVDCPRRVVAGLTDEQKRAHAIATNVYRRNLTREQRREMVRRLSNAGMSTRQIAAVAQVSHETVRQDVDRGVNDLTPRSVKGIDGKFYADQATLAQRRETVRQLRDQGMTYKEIADHLGIGESTVGDDAKALGLAGATQPDALTKSPADTPKKVERIRELAAKGYHSTQIARDLGYGETRGDQHVRKLARENDIDIPADKAIGKARRIDSVKVAAEIVATLEQLAMPIRLVNFTDLDATQAAEWANSLTESIRGLNRFAKQMKELAQQ